MCRLASSIVVAAMKKFCDLQQQDDHCTFDLFVGGEPMNAHSFDAQCNIVNMWSTTDAQAEFRRRSGN